MNEIERKKMLNIADTLAGESVPGKLTARRVRGGIVLKRTTYEMH